jgi:hypothetical protein
LTKAVIFCLLCTSAHGHYKLRNASRTPPSLNSKTMARFVVILVLLLIASLLALLHCAVVDAFLASHVTRVTLQLNNSPTTNRMLHARRSPIAAAFPRASIGLRRAGALRDSDEEEQRQDPRLRAFAELCGRLIARLLKKIVFEMIPMAIAIGIGIYIGLILSFW